MVKGEMLLNDSDSFLMLSVGKPCSGSGGYRDIDEGTTVSVKNQSGTLIGSGRLGPGVITGPTSRHACVFPFQVTGV